MSIVMLYPEPDDPLKGKFSAKYNVAAALVDGEMNIDTFSDEKIADPDIAESHGKSDHPGNVQVGGERRGSVQGTAGSA